MLRVIATSPMAVLHYTLTVKFGYYRYYNEVDFHQNLISGF